MTKLLNTCAHELMDTTPQILQSIRVETRRGRGSDISIPQFRTLRFIQRIPNSSLSSLAEHLGLTLPSVSKLVDRLVKQKLIIRQESTADRRCRTLELTKVGATIVNSARDEAQLNLAKKMAHLSDADLETIHKAMQLLRPLFTGQGK
jgi:MarR family transcriptional regulator for hemolysin